MENDQPSSSAPQAAEEDNTSSSIDPHLQTEEEMIESAIHAIPYLAPRRTRRFAPINLAPINPIQTDSQADAAMDELHGMALEYVRKWQEVANAIMEQHHLLKVPMERYDAICAAKEDTEVLEHHLRMENLKEAIDEYLINRGRNRGS